MSNRLKRRVRAIAAGCAFAVCALCIAGGVFPANAIIFDSITSAQADDWLMSQGNLAWSASNGPVTAVPLQPYQEVVTGAEGWLTNINGKGSFDSQHTLDTTDILLYGSEKQVTWKGKNGVLTDTIAMTGMSAPDYGTTCSVVNMTSSSTNEDAYGYSVMGGSSGEFHGLNAITQLDDIIPDTLETTVQAKGNGFATVGFEGRSRIGIGNTTDIGFKYDVSKRITGGGTEYGIGMKTRWSSFRNVFNLTAEA